MAGMSAVGPPGGMSGSEEPLPNPRRDDCVALSSGRFSSVHSIQGPPSKADSREGATGLEETGSPHPCMKSCHCGGACVWGGMQEESGASFRSLTKGESIPQSEEED